MDIVYDRAGTPIRLGAVIGRGGEATVYCVRDQPNLAAKVFDMDAPSRIEAKVDWMFAHPPDNPTRADGHMSFAWPLLLIYDRQAVFRGYLVAYIRNAVPLLSVFNPRLRAQALPDFDLRYLHRAARNLAATVGAIHTRDYVIGDMHESNVLVSPTAMVTFVDTDSFQVREDGLFYPCPVGKPEYTPPELQGLSFARVQREPWHDRFGLGVLIFQLLMEGSHPFRAHWLGSGDPLPLEERIRLGYFPYQSAQSYPVVPPHTAPTLDPLHPLVRHLVNRCFSDGHSRPQLRPVPAEWEGALVEAEKALTVCAQGHVYSNHLLECPRCHPSSPVSRSPLRTIPAARPLYQTPGWSPSAPPMSRPPLRTSPIARPGGYQAPVRPSRGYAPPAGRASVSPALPKLSTHQKKDIYAGVIIFLFIFGCIFCGLWNLQPPDGSSTPTSVLTSVPTSTPPSTSVPRIRFLLELERGCSYSGRQCNFGVPLIVEGDVIVAGQRDQKPPYNYKGLGVRVFTLNQDGTDLAMPEKKLESPDNSVGYSLAMSGETLAVGVPDAKNDAGLKSGAVYVYERDLGGENNWGYAAKLVASDGEHADVFGRSVAIDGDVIVVGAPQLENESGRGAIYVFRRTRGAPTDWRQVAKLSILGVYGFGYDVILDNGVLFVSAHYDWFNWIYVFECDYDGVDVCNYVAGLDGSRARPMAGTENVLVTGAGFIFERGQGGANDWKLVFESEYIATHGASVATDGNFILVGSPPLEQVYVFGRDQAVPGNWTHILTLLPWAHSNYVFRFGDAVDISGDLLVSSSTERDAVYVYRLSQAGIK